jgi:hypothetical protein
LIGERKVIVLLDGEGRAIEQYDAAHSGEGLRCLVDRLVGTTACPANAVAIAVETSWGALVETLLDHGFAVFSINPKQVDRFRDGFTMADAKDDTRDAFVLACSLRTDPRSFRLVEIDSPEIIRLRELSRFEDELKAELRRTTNRIWQQLHRYCPQVLTLSPAADDLLIWDLLRQAPTPAIGAKLSLARIQRLLHSHRISRFTADEMMTVLRAPPESGSWRSRGSQRACASTPSSNYSARSATSRREPSYQANSKELGECRQLGCASDAFDSRYWARHHRDAALQSIAAAS